MGAHGGSLSVQPALAQLIRLLEGVSLLAMMAGSLMPTGAKAACTTVSSNASVSSNNAPCILWTGGDLAITDTGFIRDTSTTSVQSSGTVGTFSNAGSLANAFDTRGGTVIALINQPKGYISGISNDGTMGWELTGVTSLGLYVFRFGATGITNAGTIGYLDNNGVISGNDYGVLNSTGTIGRLVNTGTIIEPTIGIANMSGTIGSFLMAKPVRSTLSAMEG